MMELNAGLVGLAITVMIQFGGIVWFASSIRTSVAFQADAVQKLSKAMEAMQHMAASMDRRVAVLEDRTARAES